jgi:ABC-2 type transport system ATP-binding protein
MVDQVVIDVQDLRKHYGATRAIDGVTFSVRGGEVFGMLGPNGAGKTTTIECLEGLRDPDGGIISILGMRQGPERERIKARIGLQLQTTGLYPKLSVKELLELFSTFYPGSNSVKALIELVGLTDKQNTRSKDLSGGQRQRLSLALALVGDPDIVFLDEPTTGLDPQARRALWDVVKGLKQQGKTVMLTTHYMEEAEQLCDRVAVMDHGHIIELDSPSALVARFFRETAIEFVAPAGWPLEQMASLAGVKHHLVEEGHVVLYSVDVPHTMAALLEVSSRDGQSFSEMSVRQATLEDVFLKLTGRRIRE